MTTIVGVAQKDKKALLYYAYAKNGKNFLKLIPSIDGFKFDGKPEYVIVLDGENKEEESYDWKDFKISKQKDTYFLSYKSNFGIHSNLNGALSSDLLTWVKTGRMDDIKESGMVVPEYQHENKYAMYTGGKSINIAFSSNLTAWHSEKEPALEPRKDFFDDGNLEILGVLHVDDQITLIYAVKGNTSRYSVGAAIFDKKNPSKAIWRSPHPIWEQKQALQKTKFAPLGTVLLDNKLVLYWLVGEGSVYAVSCPLPSYHDANKTPHTTLKKFDKNPIISPRPEVPWDSRAAFNSAAIYEDGKVHFVYRALGNTDLSVLGYAASNDGFNIDERSDKPVYVPREAFESPGQRAFATFADHFASGGGYGGVEDPRITKVDEKFYLTYVAFDGANPPRVALSSINVADFLGKRWDKWEKAKLISAPGMVNKNAVIFPEKINGKYVVLHRVYPNVLIDFVDDLKFDNYLQGQYFIPPRKNYWDSKKIGAGAPPIKTKDGWLFIYQSVGHQDPSRYKIGAMLLDLDDPTKVLYRSNNPLIEPDEDYENQGHKSGVVYPCGAVVKDGNLIVYYGGADTVTCAAYENLDKLLYELKHHQDSKMKKVEKPMLS